ncbi:MAG: EamA family transporter [Chloroflexi bacterium]|nr:EamA family transporter [Chloroflexota bacterium]
MHAWFTFSLIALLLWGCWGLFDKIATSYMDPKSVAMFVGPVSFMISLGLLASVHFRPELHPHGVVFALLGALAAGFGGVAYIYAISTGNIAVVVTVTSLYPPVTMFLSWLFLQETITPKKLLGIALAVLAVVLLSVEAASEPSLRQE